MSDKKLIISIISAKGGVGKTTISANLGYLLSQYSDTILVDLDYFTHGLTMSLFPSKKSFIDLATKSQDFTIYDYLINNHEDKYKYITEKMGEFIVHIKSPNSNKPLFDLLPSFFDLKQKIDWFKILSIGNEVLLGNMKKLLNKLKEKYRFIVLDTQAGEGNIGIFSTLLSNNIIAVSEHGQVQNASLESLISQIRNKELGERIKFSFFGTNPIKAYNKLTQKDYDSLKYAIKSKAKPLEKFSISYICRYNAVIQNSINYDNILFIEKEHQRMQKRVSRLFCKFRKKNEFYSAIVSLKDAVFDLNDINIDEKNKKKSINTKQNIDSVNKES